MAARRRAADFWRGDSEGSVTPRIGRLTVATKVPSIHRGEGVDMTWQKALAATAISAIVAGLPAMTANAASPIVPYGAIRAEWLAKGGATGFLGAPQDNEYTISAIPGDQVPPGARAEDFTGGVIYWSPATGAHEVHGAILQEYVAVGGTAVYGLPLTDEVTAPDGVGRFNHFSADGSIYWTPSTGAHTIYGAIKADWAARGWERGPVGYPTQDESDVNNPTSPGGRMQTFAAGQMFWSTMTGAHEVHGAILQDYLVGAFGPMSFGLPTTDEVTAPDSVGRFNHFDHDGSIYWTPTTGAHSLAGLIFDAWAGTGWERGPLGYPVSDEYAPTLAVRQNNFQHGYINWVNGVVTVHVT
jgi:uncharacterized protein with LGFP repeats